MGIFHERLEYVVRGSTYVAYSRAENICYSTHSSHYRCPNRRLVFLEEGLKTHFRLSPHLRFRACFSKKKKKKIAPSNKDFV